MKRSLLAVLAALLPLLVQGMAQQVDLTKPPTSPDPRPYKLPPITQTKLPNGLTVVLAEDTRFPLVTARLVFNAGSRRDPAELPGLAAAVGTLLTQGTETRTYRQIAEELDSLGANLSSGSTLDATAVSGTCLAENALRLISLVADAAQHAQLPEAELALYKQNQKQALQLARSKPDYLAREEFRKRVFGAHPYANLGATVASLDRIDRRALLGFRDQYLVPNNAYLIVVGKLPARATLTRLIAGEFGAWPKKEVPAYNPVAIPAASSKLILIDRPGSVQADLLIGRVALNLQSPNYFDEYVGHMILGGFPGSRLFLDIRQKRGFAYDAHSVIDDAGTFYAVTQVRNDVVPQALQAVMDDMDAMGKEPVTKDELSGAKAFANGRFLLRLEPQSGLVDRLQEINLLHLPTDYLDTYTTRVNSVEPDAVLAAGKRYLVATGATVIIVGDAAKLGKPLEEKFGKFELVKPQ